LLKFIGPLKETPEFVDFENWISLFPKMLSLQERYTLEPETEIEGEVESVTVLLRFTGALNEPPELVDFENIISLFPVVLSLQTTYTLVPDAKMKGDAELPTLLLRFIGKPNEAPESVDFLNMISLFPEVSSLQTMYVLVPDAEIEGLNERPTLLLRFTGGVNKST